MNACEKPELDGRQELERDNTRFNFWSPNGLPPVPDDARGPIIVKNTFTLARNVVAPTSR